MLQPELLGRFLFTTTTQVLGGQGCVCLSVRPSTESQVPSILLTGITDYMYLSDHPVITAVTVSKPVLV